VDSVTSSTGRSSGALLWLLRTASKGIHLHAFAMLLLIILSLPSAAGGKWWIDESGQSFYANPAQLDPSQGCTDVPPDNRYSCEQQVRSDC
jgi:hypothetical protein